VTIYSTAGPGTINKAKLENRKSGRVWVGGMIMWPRGD
jgi:hypothetical protein